MIHIICTDLSGLTPLDHQTLYEKASAERQRRADRYRRREDSLRCVAADALLRYALGTDSYTVDQAPNGKPFIKGNEHFHFNLSHAGNWIAIAYGDSEVGIDVEALRADTNIEAVARRFFAPDEYNYVFAEDDLQRQRFFEIWTGKESYIKYLGTGLKTDLRSFSVLSLEPQCKLHRRVLPDGSLLCLCTMEGFCRFTLLEARQLL